MTDSNKKMTFRSRREAIAAIEHQIRWWRSPKLAMACFVLIAGLVGFVISAILLKFGVLSMPIRYAVALLAGYSILCFAIWIWTGAHPSNIAEANSIESVEKKHQRSIPEDWSDVGSISVDESILIVTVIVALFVTVFWLISSAPTMMAELTLDSLVSMQVFYKIRPSEKQQYLSTFWRTTRVKLLYMSVLVIGGAWFLQHFVPEAHTLWQVFRFSTAP